jgi:LacI family transcriptional regulator
MYSRGWRIVVGSVSAGKRSTIREVARAAGVSASTASLVLNRKGAISGATRSRVLEVAASLEFTPKPTRGRSDPAKSIRFLKIAKHGNTINRDHNHFISDYIDGMSHEANRRGYRLQVVTYEKLPIRNILDSLLGCDARGLIALGTELSADDVRLLQSSGLPTVFIDTFYDAIEANFVDMNNNDTVYQVLSHFKAQGFRDIGFVGSEVETNNFHLRREAFFRNMEILGLTASKAHVLSIGSTLGDAHRDSLQALERGPSLAQAYFCTNDVMAFGFIQALKERGVSVPGDVAIIGFDNLPMSAIMDPALTTIDVSKRKIGSIAVGVLDDVMNATSPFPPIKVQVGAELVMRASDKQRQLQQRAFQ